MDFDPSYNQQSFMPHSYSGVENVAKMIQRSINKTPHATQRSVSSPLATESSFIEDSNFKVGRYSAEERKERISKYRAKRNQRNFSKTIKVRPALVK
ncbi:hypothetical protein NC651_001092 [Populus alba x Populus x berolinensis]|nr:hypothetical protein NC651_001092 [Populus alba x Populus x berolinensis]